MARQSKPKRSKNHFVWIDCEMTGLDPTRHVLLEIATIISNSDLKIIARGPVLAIRHSESTLKRMDGWARKSHSESGLLQRVRMEGVSLGEAERQTLNFVRKHCYIRTAPLCGNSVGHDKRFLFAYMRLLHDFLNYRIVDVSSVKLVVSRWYRGKYEAPEERNLHRALSDIEESIAELAYYRRVVFIRS